MQEIDIEGGATYVGRIGKARTVIGEVSGYTSRMIDGTIVLYWEVKGDDENRYCGSLKEFAKWALYKKLF